MNKQELDDAVALIAELDAKRTPGSFTVNNQELSGWMDNAIYILANENIARMFGRNASANAEYIAAAPLMARTVAAQAARIKELESAQQWRPIETAPKDKEVLLSVAGYSWSLVGIWNEPSKKWCYAQLSVDLYDGKWNDTSFQSEYEAETLEDGLRNVTHWMPLPAPPATGKEGE